MHPSSRPSADGLPDPEFQPGFYEGVLSKRLVAWGIDLVIVGVMVGGAVLATAFVGLLLLPLLWIVLDSAYRIVTLANRSATLGMRLMGIELRDRHGRRFDLAMAGLHTMGYVLSFGMAPLQVISVVLMLTSARAQGLTDHVLGSAAINRPSEQF